MEFGPDVANPPKIPLALRICSGGPPSLSTLGKNDIYLDLEDLKRRILWNILAKKNAMQIIESGCAKRPKLK